MEIPEGYSESDIAVVGMAAHLPGAENIDEYWRNLVDGVESVRHYSEEELLAAGVPQRLLKHPKYVRAGAPLQGMADFDGEFFGFGPKDSAILDPQHRHFLEACWEALEDAGHPPESVDGPIGIYGGCGMGSYFYFNLCSNPELVDSVGMFLLRHTGNDKDFLVTRVSHVLDLKGPAVNVQTACSTSLVAIHYAVQSLLSQECDMALAGGVTIELPHGQGYVYKEGEVLSPDGHCHAFDHRAQGTVFGSGTGVVVLRRLKDALADGDHIYAVVRGTAINNDGASKANYLAPSVSGQAECIVTAQQMADVDADSVGYIECHGTGTYLGDPIEVSALTEAFRTSTQKRGFCRLGSVKTNIGHLDTAAGVASFIKVALILEREKMPPSLGFEAPNPTIDFETSPFVVNSELRDWKRGPVVRRAGVQSLGVGGTNAHIVLQEAPVQPVSVPSKNAEQILFLSARNRGALQAGAERLAAYFESGEKADFADVAYTLFVGRRKLDRRRVLVARDANHAAQLLRDADSRRVFAHQALTNPKVVFLFPGGGAQYFAMGHDLYESDAVYREWMDKAFSLLAKKNVDFDLKSLLFVADPQEQLRKRLAVQLPAIFASTFAMVKVLESQGVTPSAMLGHSLGEYAAATNAGVFSFEEALGLVLFRGQLFDELPEGAMLSVPVSAEVLRTHLGAEVDLAGANAPDLSIASGPAAAVKALEDRLLALGIEPRRVEIDRAAHSRMLEPVLGRFRDFVAGMKRSAPQKKLVSGRTGTWLTEAQAMDPQYWTDHLRHSVEFGRGVTTLRELGDAAWIEVGPGKALGAFAKSGGVEAQAVVNAFRHKDEVVSDATFALELLARLYALGVNVPLERRFAGEKRRRVRLPTYAFQRQRYFIEPGKGALEAAAGLQRMESVADFGFEPYWVPTAAVPAANSSETFLLFLDDVGIGLGLKEKLLRLGHRVVVVHPGDTFLKKREGEYVLSPERGAEGYEALVRDLVASGRVPSRVVHLWLLTGEESFRPGSSFFHRNQERGFWSLFFLLRTMAEENLPRPLHVTAVANGAVGFGDERVLYPEKAMVFGPMRVAPREFPGLTTSTIDVALPAPRNTLFGGSLTMALADPFSGKRRLLRGYAKVEEAILEDLLAVPATRDVLLRDGKRFERGYRQKKLEGADRLQFRAGSTFLLSGGFGGLASVAAQELARTVERCRLVLVSRRSLPSRADWDEWVSRHGDADATSRSIALVRSLEQLGAEVLVVAADVTNVADMRTAVQQARTRFGRIEGVFHTAGLVKDAPMLGKSLSDIEDVFAPKVHGSRVLLEVLGDEPDFVCFYSSTSVAIAPPGQADYVAANAYLDALAGSASGRPRLLSVAWGIWNQVGMAAEALGAVDHSVDPKSQPPVLGAPLLSARGRDAKGVHFLTGDHETKALWVYDEHRVVAGDKAIALIPGTGYLELIAEFVRDVAGNVPFEVADLLFLRPLQIDKGSKVVRLFYRPTDTGYGVEVRSDCMVDGRSAWQLHALANVHLNVEPAKAGIDVAEIYARCGAAEVGTGLQTPQEQHLRFGARWRVLSKRAFGTGEAMASLASSFNGDFAAGFRLHPALLDIATGYAMNLIEGYTPSSLWVPVSYERVRVFADLPPRVHSWVRNSGANRVDSETATFDVTLVDDSGKVVLEISRFSIRRLTGTANFTKMAAPTRNEVVFERAEEQDGRGRSPAEERLRRNLELGIRPVEGGEALRAFLSGSATHAIVSSLPLTTLLEEASRSSSEVASSSTSFERPDLDTEYVAPRDDVERTLVGFWEDLLGVKGVGVRDSFFDLGGHSLIAVRLFSMVKKSYSADFPISVLFEAPTIEGCGALIKEEIGWSAGAVAGESRPAETPKRRYTHIVPMSSDRGASSDKPPFFLVAGMFGNVLNLRHLAHLVGADRPFYGLQARGLYGGDAPHESFEEMAKDYLAEVRTVAPHGPYVLGGFSGGGYTALEMARQLRAAGEEVASLVLLDTPGLLVPERLSVRDRARIQIQRLEKQGPRYVVDWASKRIEWETRKLRKRFEEPEPLGEESFHNEAIEGAFRRSLERYSIPRWDGDIVLFRPPLEKAYDLGDGRFLNHDREYVHEDNGWSRYCSRVLVHEVPGDHDSMVLEPNVRVLAAKLRELLGDWC